MKLTDQDKAALRDLQPMVEILHALVISLGAMNPQAMPIPSTERVGPRHNGVCDFCERS
jgi:hypothetical protein